MPALRLRPWRALEPLQQIASPYHISRTSIASRAISSSAPRVQNNTSNTTTTPRPSGTSSSQTSSPSISQASRVSAPTPNRPTTDNISKSGLSDKPLELESAPEEKIDWTRSFHGLSAEPFPKEAANILLAETDPEEVEIKPDGILYLPEIKYRRILNRAFGPGGWGLVPRSESIVTPRAVTREYALVCNGR